MDPEKEDTRQVQTVFVAMPRKNGKTALAAAVALKCLCADGEREGQVYSAAADRKQASLVFNAAKRMVMNDPRLRERCKIVDSQKTITYLPTDSIYCALSSDADTKHGFSASAIIFDEVHTQPNRELWDVLTTSTGARDQALLFAITTAGYDKQSLCWEQWDYAQKVRDGVFQDPTFLPVLYSMPDEADWLDESLWHLVNPALGDFRSLDEMRKMALKAQRIPSEENTFRRLYLNQWTEQESRWIQMSDWLACYEDFDVKELLGRPCWVGLDLSTTTDITACVLVFPMDDGTYRIVPHFWVPEEDMRNRERRDRIGYSSWIRQGYLNATHGNTVHQDEIEGKIKSEFAHRYEIRELAIDRWNSAQITVHLQDAGMTVVPFGQGYGSMAEPCKELERLILSRRLRHNNHPVLNWMMSNVTVVTDDAGNIKMSKKKSSEKIDGAVAMVMGLGRALVQGGDGPSVYEKEGLLFL